MNKNEITKSITFVLENLLHFVEELRHAEGLWLVGTTEEKHDCLDNIQPKEKHIACYHQLFKCWNTFMHNYFRVHKQLAASGLKLPQKV
jgi:hypothetical protein